MGGTPGTGGAASTAVLPGAGGAPRQAARLPPAAPACQQDRRLRWHGRRWRFGNRGRGRRSRRRRRSRHRGGKDASPPAEMRASVGYCRRHPGPNCRADIPEPRLRRDPVRSAGDGTLTTQQHSPRPLRTVLAKVAAGSSCLQARFLPDHRDTQQHQFERGYGRDAQILDDPTKYLPVVEVSWESSLLYNYHPLIWPTMRPYCDHRRRDHRWKRDSSDWYAWAGKETADQTALRTQNANGVPIAQRIYGSGTI